VFTGPTGAVVTLSNAFNVTNGGGAILIIQLLTRPNIGPTANSNIDLVISNAGNVDAVGLPVTVSGFPSGWSITPSFLVLPPPAIPGQEAIDWSTLPIAYDTASSQGQMIPLFLSKVAPGATVVLHFTVNPRGIASPAQLQLAIGTPVFESPYNPNTLSCSLSARWVGGAMSRENEEPQGTSSVTFRVPDFVDDDGIEYTDIEVILDMDGDIRVPPALPIKSNVPISVDQSAAQLIFTNSCDE